jgi:hypothetical protein
MRSELNRRDFLKKTSLTLVGSLAVGSSAWAKEQSKIELLLAKPIEKIRPDWLEGASDYKLPEWYDKWRVCLHTRLGRFAEDNTYHNKGIFLTAAQKFRSLGTNVFVRHIKTGSEGAWWPSKVGYVEPWAKDHNYAKEIIDNAHKVGCRIIVYHRHMEDRFMAKQHPDWVCRINAKGDAEHRRGVMLCFNSPYADYFEKRLLELVDMGADALYFDEVHMPKTGCWCKFCKKKFKEMTGLDHPDQQDNNNPVWRKLRDFNNYTIEQTFLRYRKALHARNPEIVMLVGSNRAPSMFDRHMTHRMSRISDSVKTEYSIGARTFVDDMFKEENMMPLDHDSRVALGYAISRDGADGRPPHIWIPFLGDERSAMFAVAGVVAHGCIANPDHREPEIPNPEKFKKAVELGNKVSPYLAGTRPLRWTAIHYPEDARDQLYPDNGVVWRKALYPFAAVHQVLLRNQLGVNVITDSQLEDNLLNGYKVLYLPAPDYLTDPMKAAIADFKSKGGLVIKQQPDWKWYDSKDSYEKSAAQFISAINQQAAPVQAFGGNREMHTSAFKAPNSKDITVTIVNDFKWVKTHRDIDKKTGKKIVSADYIGKVPPPCKNVRLEIRKTEKPKKLFNAVTGKELKFTQTDKGISIDVPEFEILAVVVAQY